MTINDTVLTVIDVQGKLAGLMHEHERLFHNMERFIKIAHILNIPILCTEQAPDKIGPTVAPIAQLLFPKIKPIPKRSFSCYGCPEFKEAIDASGRRRVLITGIEAHVCVYQTARDLHEHGYEVHLLEDAISSRSQSNTENAVERLRDQGILIVSAEMAACELLRSADHSQFREVMANIKR